MKDLSREALMHLLYVIWDGLWRMEKFPSSENSRRLYDCKDSHMRVINTNISPFNLGLITLNNGLCSIVQIFPKYCANLFS